MRLNWWFVWSIFYVGTVAVEAAHAQAGDAGRSLGANVGWELGAHLGNLLPNQIDGLTEIVGKGGIRLGARVGRETFSEFEFTSGNGEGAEWMNLALSLRLDYPIDQFVGIAYIGPDLAYLSTGGAEEKQVRFGGHIGGGIMSSLGGITWFRADMKFGVNPGTYLFIGFSFVLRIDGSGFGGGSGGSGI